MTNDVNVRALRSELLREFRAKPRIYWIDLTTSAALAWIGYAGCMIAPELAWVLGPIAVFAVYRATYFVHEIAHQRKALPGFELAWNLVVGMWVLVPSFMVDPHADHHRLATYGTRDDPEYEEVASFGRVRLALSIASGLLVPLLLFVRFAILSPLSLLVPALRTIVLERASTLATNPSYRRDAARSRTSRVAMYETLASATALSIAGAIAVGLLPLRVAVVWYAIGAGTFTINQARTLLAHGYRSDGSKLGLAAQVADSTAIARPTLLTTLTHPLGTEFHALHHLAPSLPYHSLREADRRIRAGAVPLAYGATQYPGFARGLYTLFARAERAPLRRLS
jgi:fatty acid desaturase